MTRVALVTGAARGIGAAVAAALAARGIATAIADLDRAAAEATATALSRPDCPSVPYELDVAHRDDVRRTVSAVTADLGTVDILVNNAGILSTTGYAAVTDEEWDTVMAINVSSAMAASQACLPLMVERGWGRIVMVSSFAGRAGGVSVGPAYAASKAALLGLTKNLARQVAAFGVTVNAVAPGTTDTPLAQGFTADELRRSIAAIPVGRLGRPDEVAETVAFLASEAAGFITGACLDVNGGMYMA